MGDLSTPTRRTAAEDERVTFTIENGEQGFWFWYELHATVDGVKERLGRDGGEPEDQNLHRDWKWVKPALERFYALGVEHGRAAVSSPPADGDPGGCEWCSAVNEALGEHRNTRPFIDDAVKVLVAKNEAIHGMFYEWLAKLVELAGPMGEPVDGKAHRVYAMQAHVEAALESRGIPPADVIERACVFIEAVPERNEVKVWDPWEDDWQSVIVVGRRTQDIVAALASAGLLAVSSPEREAVTVAEHRQVEAGCDPRCIGLDDCTIAPSCRRLPGTVSDV